MISLLKIEWLKIKKYPAFWWMLGIVALTYPGVNFVFYNIYLGLTTKKDFTSNVAKQLFGNPFAFPETWHSVAYFSSCFVMIPAILVIMIITNEYQYKTSRQNVIDGWSRGQFITSKILDVAIITIVATLMYLATATAYGFSIKDTNNSNWAEEIKYIPLFLLQTFAQLSIAFLLGFLIKKAFIALGVFIFYSLIIENIAEGYLRVKDVSVRRFLPLEISDKLIPVPKFVGKFNGDVYYNKQLSEINTHILLTIILTSAIWGLCFYIYKKRDL